jgi:hypothetical protein
VTATFSIRPNRKDIMPAARSTRTRLTRLVAPLAILTLTLAACGDDDGSPAEAAPVADGQTVPAEPTTIEVTAVDFEFQNLPERVPVGTKLTLVNNAPTELHELVAFRLPDDEDRSVEELLSQPFEELVAMFEAEEPAAVLLAAPGGEQIAAVGDGTLTEPGRYAILCIIPTGVEPEAYLAAAAESEGPPQVEAGPPHIAHGMFAELIVE